MDAKENIQPMAAAVVAVSPAKQSQPQSPSSQLQMSPATERQIANAILDRVADEIVAERLAENRKAVGALQHAERVAREATAAAFLEYFDLLGGRLAFLAERHQRAQPIHARAGDAHCISRQRAKELDMAAADAARERWCREQGRRDVEADQVKRREDLKRREENRRRLREDMVGFRAAGVFLIAEETRQRTMLDGEFGAALTQLRRRFADDEAAAMTQQIGRERREDAARAEVVAAAKREAAALDDKRNAEVQRRQQKLINKCTHARNGGSVFAGSYPKKMCLICRIKLDAISGLYVMMERSERR